MLRQTGVVQQPGAVGKSCSVLHHRVYHRQTRGGCYNPPLRKLVGDMTNELGRSYITEYVSNGPKNYAYRTGGGNQVVKVNGFTLNCVVCQQLTFVVMKEMAISEQLEQIIVTES